MKYPLDAADKQALIESGDAMRRGDTEAASRALARVKHEPGILMLLKERHGADYVRRRGFDTTLADQEYGPGWLDKD